MKITNFAGLPQAIVDAVSNDGYTRGDADISVTALISPPRKVALEALHGGEITEEAADRIWSLMGQSIHTILERANRKGIAERRLSITVEGWKISGGMDLYEEDGVLVDYKVTSAWSVKDGVKPEWTAQLNCYAEILRENGHPVKGLKIVAILRDWSKMEARRDPGYPQSQVATFQVQLWDSDKTKAFIRNRVILHQLARTELPLCTFEERWAKPDTFAVMKKGAKRATKVYDNEKEAEAHAKQDSALFVETRQGENVRCKNYCSVAKFCRQFQVLESAERSDWETKPSVLGQDKAG